MLFLYAALALGNDIVIHATVPAEVHLDGQIVAQLFVGGELRLPSSTGEHKLVIYRNGRPEQLSVSVQKGLDSTVTVGKSGITTGAALERMPPPGTKIAVEFRVDAVEGAMLVLGEERVRVPAGTVLERELDAGQTKLSVRNTEGTVVWATGALNLESGPVIVHIQPGRLPEVPSLGGSFQPSLD